MPASSANLGPGFDCLGLALDLWNEVHFETSLRSSYYVSGEGARALNIRPDNLLTRAMSTVYEVCGRTMGGIQVTAMNRIPLSSGLGSSAAAIMAGLFGANELLDQPLDTRELLKLGAEIEGHPDNAAPALLGGLVVSAVREAEIITRRYEVPILTLVVVKPEVNWPTHLARSVLPRMVPRSDAIFNIGRTALVVEALRHGDLDLLQRVMEDRLHQSYRLERIPAGREAYQAARACGAAALSGAGPSIITFVEPGAAQKTLDAVHSAFSSAGVQSRGLILHASNSGAQVL
ncbi:MAG: homoserine kinase [Bacteroidota bacterium]